MLDYKIPSFFVSYCHRNNERKPGQTAGWVTNFVNTLKIDLGEKFAKHENYHLFIDENEIKGNNQIDDKIFNELKNTDLLIIILTNAFLESQYCQEELNFFVKNMKTQDFERIFVVEKEIIKENKKPNSIKNLKGFRFINAENNKDRLLGGNDNNFEQGWYDQILTIAETMKNKILQIHPPNNNKGIESSKNKVYLAQVTEDLHEKYRDLKNFLEDNGYQVVPESPIFEETADAYAEKVNKDLDPCILFIQVLSDLNGKWLYDNTPGFCVLQYQCAVESNKPVLVWRGNNIKWSQINDNTHKDLLRYVAVHSSIGDFKKQITRHLTPQNKIQTHEFKIIPEELLPYPGLRHFDRNENKIFFGCDEQVKKLLDKLKEHRFIAVVGPSGSGKSSLVRAGLIPYIEQNHLNPNICFWRIAIMQPNISP
ncbi:Toll-Interleukin receptor domain protein, partial [Candidatus Magnetomorum sp. HK-1]